MPLTLISHGAAALNARMPAGGVRGVAGKIGYAHSADRLPDPPAGEVPRPGRVCSAGAWQSALVHSALAAMLGAPLAPSLRTRLEWYLTRGAFFHNDAHYEGVLFGVWCIAGPPAELVFPRLGVRIDASPGRLAVFDPFEVHGVLSPGRDRYASEDYDHSPASVFVGFELELTAAVAQTFDVAPAADAPTLSSATRIDPTTGAVV
jgi:hypothetical protein